MLEPDFEFEEVDHQRGSETVEEIQRRGAHVLYLADPRHRGNIGVFNEHRLPSKRRRDDREFEDEFDNRSDWGSVNERDPNVPMVEAEPVKEVTTEYCAFEEDGDDSSNVAAEDKEFCFLCECSQDPHEYTEFTDIKLMIDIIHDHIGFMKPTRLAMKVKKFYDDKIRDYLDDKIKDKEWSVPCIMKHISEHNPTPYTMTMTSVRQVNTMINILHKQHICIREKKNHKMRKLDGRSLREYKELVKLRMALLREVKVYEPQVRNI